LDERQHRGIDLDFESLDRPSWTVFDLLVKTITVLSRVTAFPNLMIIVFSEVAVRDVCADALAQHVRDSHHENLWAHCSGRAHSRHYREAI
jgi:hypothetical protein